MELITCMLFKRLNPSDFKKMYNLDKPSNGGGQTYIELAGIDEEDLLEFVNIAEKEKKNNDSRFLYKFDVYSLGSNSNKEAMEIDPRNNRKNYRIRNQSLLKKHSAWHHTNGFPQPPIDNNGNYINDDKMIEQIIESLYIIILKTSFNKYYATYIDDPQKTNLPAEIIDSLIQRKRGIVFFNEIRYEFNNDRNNFFTNPIVVKRRTGGENILYYGVPGSGKSHIINQKYCLDDSKVERIVFHPDYMNTDFVGQILPMIQDDDTISYSFSPGPFSKILKSSYDNPQDMYYLVIEEINRGNAPSIFGEIFQLLDRTNGQSTYKVTNHLISRYVFGIENKKIKIPSNLTILATMNTADQNVFTLDTAFQRRWKMKMIQNDISSISHASIDILDTNTSWKKFNETINSIIISLNQSNFVSSEDKRLGAYFITEADLNEDNQNFNNTNNTDFHSLFGEKVLKYLWDDAFKFNRNELFNTNDFQSLEDIIKLFNNSIGKDRWDIFIDDVKNSLNI
ncbi:AAA family ATPase [Staphylococcus hominis]